MIPRLATAADTEGCADLKAISRLEGCVIQECSARQHDTFEVADATTGSIDATVNALNYTCPAASPNPSADLARVKRELDAKIHKAGYQNVAPDNNPNDPANPGGIARKGSEWLRWSATVEDGTVSYSVASAGDSMEACGRPPMVSSLKQCEVVECVSKAEDSVAMRTAQKGETSLTGNVQTVTLSCPSASAAKAFAAVEGELTSSGFEILFHENEHPDSGWLTARSRKHWVGLVSTPDGESVSYALTVVGSAEVLTAATLDSAPVAPAPAPEPKQSATAPSAPATTSKPEPVSTVATMPPAAPAPVPINPAPQAAAFVPPSTPVSTPAIGSTAPSGTNFIPPKPILQVPIEATHDRIYSVMGDVVITLLVDVSQDGTVTKAELAGRITKDVRKLESAALDAVSHWRFEPARQDGRVVPAVRIPVQMHFHGHPWQY